MLSEIFYTFLITSGTAFIIGMTKLIYNSKCKEVKCCCLHIIRDTEAEEQIDELVINRQPIQQPIQQNTV